MPEDVQTRSVLVQRDTPEWLEERLGPLLAAQRLQIERDHEAEMIARGGEGWAAASIRKALVLTGLYERGRENTARVQMKHHNVEAQNLPRAFDGFAILHISDLHIDMNLGAVTRLLEMVERLKYDICVLTGDFRGKTFGSFDESLEGLACLRSSLGDAVYAVLGNHDSAHMTPGIEEMGVQVLLNESVAIERGGQRLYLAGIDDAHLYRTHDIAKAASHIPRTSFSILLSHSPEVYREAAGAGFDLLLSGHTHGGQICLPGSLPITLCAQVPRRMGAGAWKYQNMCGYTSVGLGSSLVPVRFNCAPEITLHHLRSGQKR